LFLLEGGIKLKTPDYEGVARYANFYNIDFSKIQDFLNREPMLHPNVNWDDKIQRAKFLCKKIGCNS